MNRNLAKKYLELKKIASIKRQKKKKKTVRDI